MRQPDAYAGDSYKLQTMLLRLIEDVLEQNNVSNMESYFITKSLSNKYLNRVERERLDIQIPEEK